MAATYKVEIIRDESATEIPGIVAIGGNVLSATAVSGGRVVTTGYVADQQSHVTVVDSEGSVLSQKIVKKPEGSTFRPHRRCNLLSTNSVVTMCESGQLGTYNLQEETLIEKDIKDLVDDVIEYWSPDRYISCVAANPVSGNVFVGTKSTSSAGLVSRDMLVFDQQLNYQRRLILPDALRGSRDVVFHCGRSVICDHCTRNAYMVTMEGSEAELVFQFEKPELDGADWIPYKVCTDSHDYIYMLWESWGTDDWKAVLTQHSPDGRRLLKTIQVDGYSDAITTLKVDQDQEKLLVIAKNTARMYKFCLIPTQI